MPLQCPDNDPMKLKFKGLCRTISIIFKLQRVFKTTEFQKQCPSYLHVRLYLGIESSSYRLLLLIAKISTWIAT